MKQQPTFCVSLKLWLHPDMHIWVCFFFDPEDIKSLSLGAETLAKEQGFLN